MILTSKEFYTKYKISRQTFYRWLDKGLPVLLKIGKTIRVDEDAVLQWIHEQETNLG